MNMDTAARSVKELKGKPEMYTNTTSTVHKISPNPSQEQGAVAASEDTPTVAERCHATSRFRFPFSTFRLPFSTFQLPFSNFQPRKRTAFTGWVYSRPIMRGVRDIYRPVHDQPTVRGVRPTET